MTPQQKRIIRKIGLNPELSASLRPEKSLPEPHRPSGRVKAIVLGADPSNPSNAVFTHVFGIGGKDKRYFQGIENNLRKIGLSREDVFVQNVVQNYCQHVTEKNEVWEKLAKLWLPELKRELDAFEPSVPVFITAGKILFSLSDFYKSKGFKFSTLYREPSFVDADKNVLGRKIFPLYRNPYYSLGKKEWEAYTLFVKRELEQ